jgi:hypothetical protein
MSDIKEHLKKATPAATAATMLIPGGAGVVGIKKITKKIKKHIDTKKGKFPETESLTHQKGPYIGDVGSEKRPKRPKGGWTS